MKKRRHHYVWRKYLSAWSVDESIWCLRSGKIFKTNLMGVGQKRDFYKLKELSLTDIEFIKKIAIEPSKGKLKESNEGWLKMFSLVTKFREFFEKNGYSEPELEAMLDEAEHNLEEDFHSLIEREAIKDIDSILNRDISFYSNDDGCMNFAFYLCTQYMRTNKIKQSILQNFQGINGINIENCWSIMRHVYATNMAWVLFADRNRFRLVLIVNETSTPFISGDQPVINTYAAGKLGNETVDKVEFYYPVSPSVAILISEKEEYQTLSEEFIAEDKAIEFNNMMFDLSHEQIYAKSHDELQSYMLESDVTN